MQFQSPLKRGRLIKRYKRFLADIALDDGELITASCPNTGSMMGLSAPDMGVWVSESDSKTRKYRHTLELVEAQDGDQVHLVGINTGHPNKIVSEAIAEKRVPKLRGYATLKREQKYGRNSRIDILLSDDKRGLCYVEIKNVHLLRHPRLAEFPDSVTARGAKHLDELGDMVEAGHRAVMFFLVQRGDAKRFSLACDIDPAYGEAFARARSRGVECLVYGCEISADEIRLGRALRFED